MSDVRTINDLRRAKELLFERGWHQGDIEGEDGSVCALGAIAFVIGVRQYGQVYKALEETVTTGVCFRSIPEWNDEPGRTFDEVLDAFDLTIKRLEQP